MQFEGIRRSSEAPNLTPLIDIVFLLLVFFLLTAHFVKDEGIAIQLPQAESAVTNDDEAVVEVVVEGSGNILVGGEAVAVEDLEQRLSEALTGKAKKWVTLRGDKQAELQSAIAVLDAARKAGAESVDMVTEKP